MLLTLFSALALAAAPATGASTAQPGTLMTLKAPENVWDCAAEDLDQNGVNDLLLSCCDERSDPLKKLVAVYLAGSDGTYPAEPSFTCPLDESVGVLFLAEVDGKAPRELVAADAEGAQIYRFESGGLVKGAKVDCVSLFPTRAKEPLFLKNTASDLDGDGRDEWLIPVPRAYDVWDGAKRKAHVNCDVVSELRRMDAVMVINRLPAVQSFDLPGTPGKALAFLSDEFADFATGPGWAAHTRVRIPVNMAEKWDASAKMADINNDGFPDLMVTQTKGTVNLTTTTQVYIAPEPMKYAEKPTATFTAEGSIASPSLLDVNNDGLRDMVVIKVPFGLKNIMNYFMRRKVTVTAQLYVFNGKDFGAKPAFETDLTLDAPEGREQVAHAMDDFNGDKLPDLCLSETHDQLSFFAGVDKGFLASKPYAKFAIPSFGEANALDLNHNNAKDCVLYRNSGKDQKRVDVILF